MTDLSPSLSDLLVEAIESRLAELHAGLPAYVVRFYPESQSCDVQPALLRAVLDDDGETVSERMPQIQNVPIFYPAGGGFRITWPLEEGDIVFLAFAERSLDRWLEAGDGDEVDPQESRRHDLSDAIALPGIRQRSFGIAQAPGTMTLGKFGGGVIQIRQNEVRIFSPGRIALDAGGETADQSIPRGEEMLAHIEALRAAFNDHTHAAGLLVAPAGGGPVTGATEGPSQTAGAPGDVLSGSAKVP